tara:strand:+ start:53 stop:292 length:240 start_codon:yes stop_codon:yes gene_type:complete
MKKLLLILLCLPFLFISCEKEENCNCGDFIDRVGSKDFSTNTYKITVSNDCTSNVDTFYVSPDVLNYAETEKRYCTGVW